MVKSQHGWKSTQSDSWSVFEGTQSNAGILYGIYGSWFLCNMVYLALQCKNLSNCDISRGIAASDVVASWVLMARRLKSYEVRKEGHTNR